MKRIAFLALVLLLASGRAAATDYSGARVRLDADGSVLPAIGELFEFKFVVEATRTVEFVGATFGTGRGSGGENHWDPISMDLPVEQTVEPGTPLEVDVQLFCNDPTEPIWFDVQIDGVKRRKMFHLLPPAPGVAGVRDPIRPLITYDGPLTEDVQPFARTQAPAKDVAGASDPALLGADESEDFDAGVSKSVVRRISGRLTMSVKDKGSDHPVNGATLVFYDEDSGADDQVGMTITLPDGSFELDYWWGQSEEPDIYIEVYASNSAVDVVEPTLTEPTYLWTTQTRYNVSANYDWGEIYPNKNSYALHALTCITQMYGWLKSVGYGGMDRVDVLIPDSDWPHYSDDEIFMSVDRMWESGTLWHEYGHHVMYRYSDFPSGNSDYCNPGAREDYIEGDTECRHAGWCKETSLVAWAEGFPNWMADYMTRRWIDRYGDDPSFGENNEEHGKCGPGNNGPDPADYDDPNLTERAFAALVRDLEDSEIDADKRGLGLGIDEINYNAKTMLDVAFGPYFVASPVAFLEAFRQHEFVGSPNALWEVAYNNGFNLDQEPPGVVTNLQSPTHPTTAPSKAAEIRFTWDFAGDNMSGVLGYSVFIADTPTAPDLTMDIGDVESLWTDPLPPGSYYFTIRAVDKVGLWSTQYAQIGPVVIREPEPANLLPSASPNYAYPAVPRTQPLLFPGIANVPSSLGGAPGQFYMNVSVLNDGELPTTATSGIYTSIDGEVTWTNAILASAPLGPDTYVRFENLGPVSIPAGRHTITVVVDGNDALAEPVETDNRDVRQWVFSPTNLPNGIATTRPTPPMPFAGWRASEQTAMTAPNCQGTRINAAGAVLSAVVLEPNTREDDYDLRSHPLSINPLTGFDPAWPSGAWEMAVSMRPAGFVDLVMVNPTEAGADVWDVAILNANSTPRLDPPPNEGFAARRIDSVGLSLDLPAHSQLGAGRTAALFHHTLPPRTSGERVVTIDAPSGTGSLYVAAYAGDLAHAGLLDHVSVAAVDPSGNAKVNFSAASSTHAILVWREPAEDPALLALPFTIEVRAPRPDAAASKPAGWEAALVPRPAADGTPGSVGAPTSLVGDVASTYLNTFVSNRTALALSDVVAEVRLDGEVVDTLQWPTLAGFGAGIDNASAPITVRGGRHTLTLAVDPLDGIVEEEEDNNLFGRQWVFVPSELAVGSSVVRGVPPLRSGGYQSVEAVKDEFLAPNCDGLRLAAVTPTGNDGHWVALVVAPGDSSDVNLSLHKASTGPDDGFDAPLVSSSNGPGEIDYVLVNGRAVQPRPYDVGIERMSGEQDYQAWSIGSTWLGSSPGGSYGPFALGSGVPAALYELELSPGLLTLRLESLDPGVDWGVALHRTKLLAHSPMRSLATSTASGPGANEQLNVEIPEAGSYCLVVFRRNASDLPGAASFQLVVGEAATAAPTPVPFSTAIVGTRPNPFNPRTRIEFVLDRTEAVVLRVHDVRGVAVRTLVEGLLEAGAHTVVWDGRDDRGGRVASGVYFARLEGSSGSSTRKLVLVK